MKDDFHNYFPIAMFRGTRYIFKNRIIKIFKKNIKWLIEVVNFQMQGQKKNFK